MAKDNLEDPLFWRIAMVLCSLPFFLIAGFPIYCSGEFELSWVLAIWLGFLAFGLWLVYSAVFVDDEVIRKRSEMLRGPETEDFLIAALVVIVPIYAILKLALRRDAKK